jgi:hypothetical protein
MITFEIVWESGNKTRLTGENIEDAVRRVKYDKCVLEKMVSYVEIEEEKESTEELLNKQNAYIEGVGFFSGGDSKFSNY